MLGLKVMKESEFRTSHRFQTRHKTVCLTVCQDIKQLENRPDRNVFILAWETVL